MLTSVSSSILAPSACSRASRVSSEEFPDLWSVKRQGGAQTLLFGVYCAARATDHTCIHTDTSQMEIITLKAHFLIKEVREVKFVL